MNLTVLNVIFKTRVRDKIIGGDNPFRWQDVSTDDIGSKEFDRSVRRTSRKGVLHLCCCSNTQALITQMSQMAACNRYHSVVQQLSRWLLLSQDYTGCRARRHQQCGVKQKLISYRRRDFTIFDHVGLEVTSCWCYRIDKEIYKRVLG